MINPEALRSVLRKQLKFTLTRRNLSDKVYKRNLALESSGIPEKELVSFFRENIRVEVAQMLIESNRSEIIIDMDQFPLLETLWYHPMDAIQEETDE